MPPGELQKTTLPTWVGRTPRQKTSTCARKRFPINTRKTPVDARNFFIVLAARIVAGTMIIAFEAVGGWPGLFAVAIAARKQICLP